MEGYKLINNELKKFSGSTYVDSELSTVSENPVQNKIITKEINDLKKSVSDGKTLVATAITEKGVETAADATFAVMADNISQIETGGGELHGATISVTTTEENLVGMEITLSLNSVIVQTKVFDENMICSFTDIQEIGTYTVYSSDGTDNAEFSVEITSDNIINKTVILCEFYLTPDGETVTPVDDVAILLKCAEIKDKPYTTIDEVLADNDTMYALMSDENAMKYLARSTGFADAGCANETFMTYLGQSPYVDGTVLNSDIWSSAICDSSFFDKVLDEAIPTMTSNITPIGQLSGSGILNSARDYYCAVDKNDNTNWCGVDNTTNGYMVYKFPNAVCVKVCELFPASYQNNNRVRDFEIQASNNGSDLVTLYAGTFPNGYFGRKKYNLNNSKSYLYYKITIKNSYSNVVSITEIQYYK